MIFASPIWLWGLLPWAGVGIWLLIRRARRVEVPFARLWQIPQGIHSRRRGINRPPWMVMLLLAAMLLAILGAAQPHRASRVAAAPLSIVVDCGITMSAGRGIPRYQSCAQLFETALLKHYLPRQVVDLYPVPGSSPIRTTLRNKLSEVAEFRRTALDTRSQLRTAVEQLLVRTAGPVFVLSDQSIGIKNVRLIQLSPSDSPEVVGISGIGANLVPHPQVMVRLRNQSSQKRVALVVSSGGQDRRISVDLPPAPEQKTLFVDFQKLGETIHASVESEAEGWAGSQAWLVRQNRPIHVASSSALSHAMQRMITVYNQSQPDGGDAISVVQRMSELRANQPAAILAADASDPSTSPVDGLPLKVADSPLTDHVDWGRVVATARLASLPAGDWDVLISSAGRAALAIARGNVRRVWVGIGSSTWPQFPDYVIFWKNVFDYLGGGVPIYRAETVHAAARLWPGLYRDSRNRLEAFNAPDVLIPLPSDRPWRRELAGLSPSNRGGADFSKWFFLAGLICGFAAMCGRNNRSLGALKTTLAFKKASDAH